MPDVTMLFIYALIICWFLSYLLSFVDFNYYHPVSKEKITVINMFNYEEIILFITAAVKNFINFPPLGITIVATLGIGIAESSGFINTALKKNALVYHSENVDANGSVRGDCFPYCF
ncbi:Aminobenzoyl-glutamate transport protein [Providencia stuartii]|nr:Aminobenzoyl-glutamate transport protein [Providencia stuartii]